MYKFRDHTPLRSSHTVDDYKDAFEDLREDFECRCGYCNVSDTYVTTNYFEIDHYRPQSKFKHLKHEYDNLIYSCKNCNNFKSSYWATDNENQALNCEQTEGIIDPCTDEYSELFNRNNQGFIVPNDKPVSQFMYKRLKLYLFKKAFYHKLDQIDSKINAIMEHKNVSKIDGIDALALVEMKQAMQKHVNKVELSYKIKQ